MRRMRAAWAQWIVERLLDEAILAPVSQWKMRHIAARYDERILKIPEAMRKEHMRAIEACVICFSKNRTPIRVGDGEWWFPFPYGWKSLGTGAIVGTIFDPSQAAPGEMIENPFLPEGHMSWFR